MRGHSTQDVANLLGFSHWQVRSYARAGFLNPQRGPRGEYRFSFQDLIVLRAAKALVEARIPHRRVERGLRQLRRQLPHEQSLTEVYITAIGGEIFASDGARAWDAESGQMEFGFAVADVIAAVEPLGGRALPDPPSRAAAADPDHWYERGLELEAEHPDAAREAYGRALACDPEYANAHVNLGRLLQEQDRVAEAEAHYRLALAVQPRHVAAAFNLGVVLEDLGRLPEAIEAYRLALAADPDLADAHFNLAQLHERRGDRAAALRHLTSYRSLAER